MLDLLYLCDKSRRFTASRHNQSGKPIASALDLLYLCKIKRVGQRVGYLQKR